MNAWKVVRNFFSTISRQFPAENKPIAQECAYLERKGFHQDEKISLYFLFVGIENPAFEEVLENRWGCREIKSFSKDNDFFIGGWTRKIRLNAKDLHFFRKEMEALGKQYQFKFLGWGTEI